MDFSALLKPFINDKNQNFYIALSGGVDSVVLFNELTKLKKEIGFHLTAIHVRLLQVFLAENAADSAKSSVRTTPCSSQLQLKF